MRYLLPPEGPGKLTPEEALRLVLRLKPATLG